MITPTILRSYVQRLAETVERFDSSLLNQLAEDLLLAWQHGTSVWICGNGGSAANAVHWANDFLYPVAKTAPHGIRMHALSCNPAVLSCLGNDIGYEKIFAHQLQTYARSGDLLIVLSGSGNSPNILLALEKAKELGLRSYAIVGFDGGRAKALCDVPLHCEVQDMQVAEDLQMVLCHVLTQTLALKIKQLAP